MGASSRKELFRVNYHIDDRADEDDANKDADVDVAVCALLRQHLRRPLEPAEW